MMVRFRWEGLISSIKNHSLRTQLTNWCGSKPKRQHIFMETTIQKIINFYLKDGRIFKPTIVVPILTFAYNIKKKKTRPKKNASLTLK